MANMTVGGSRRSWWTTGALSMAAGFLVPQVAKVPGANFELPEQLVVIGICFGMGWMLIILGSLVKPQAPAQEAAADAR